jgi:carotenoid cleavage dioxygenase-like enzyme
MEEKPDPGWELLFQDSTQSVEMWCEAAPALPSYLHGSFYMSGPAQFSLGGYNFTCVLDAFGKINRFELSHGQICFSARMLQSKFYNDSMTLGRPAAGLLFTETVPPRKCPFYNPLCNVLAMVDSADNNFVNTLKLGKELTLLTDSTTFLDFDPRSLRVLGHRKFRQNDDFDTFGGFLGSAHPLKAATGDRWVEIMMGTSGLGQSYLNVYTLSDADGKGHKRRLLKRLPTKYLRYLHSFGLTEDYAVLPFNLRINMMMIMPPNPPSINGALSSDWEGIKVVNLNTDSQEVLTFDTKPFYHVHIANTYQNETGIVFDVTTFDEPPFSSPMVNINQVLNKTLRDGMTNVGRIKRLVLHLNGPKKGEVTVEQLSVEGRTTDFPTINSAYKGKAYCYFYANEWKHDDYSYAALAVVKYNVCNNNVREYWYRAGWYPSEPFFVADPNSDSEILYPEDQGTLMFVALNGHSGVSHFITLDATTMREVINVELPVRVPFTAHGEFFPSSFSREQIAL